MARIICFCVIILGYFISIWGASIHGHTKRKAELRQTIRSNINYLNSSFNGNKIFDFIRNEELVKKDLLLKEIDITYIVIFFRLLWSTNLECCKTFSANYYDANKTYHSDVDSCIDRNISLLNDAVENIKTVIQEGKYLIYDLNNSLPDCLSEQNKHECENSSNRRMNYVSNIVDDYVAQVDDLAASLKAGIIKVQLASAECFDDAMISFSQKVKSHQTHAADCIKKK